MANQDVLGKLLSHRYRIEKLIARGGMASVYLAEDVRLEREVAVKIIHAHLSDDASFQGKFLREAKMVAKLSHPNIVNIFDQGQDGDLTYLVMEYVPSITLREALTRFGPIPAKRSLEIFQRILEGLSAAHQIGILHRDIKPENIFLADDGRIKLGDFGLARSVDSHTNTGALIGTIAYLSPELITRGQADARSDVYAAGIVLFEMLTGRQPFQGEEPAHIAHQHTSSDMPIPSQLTQEIPPIVDELVLWATARAPHHRPANAGEFLTVARKVSEELKAGRGATAKLQLPDLARTRLLEPVDLQSDATAVISDFDDLVSGDEIDSELAYSTVDLSSMDEIQGDRSLDSTMRLDLESDDSKISALERLAQRRKIRGRISMGLIPLLTVLAALAGWWFSAGPAGVSGLPELSNLTVEQALSDLEPFAPNVTQVKENSATIPAGRVIGSEPQAGSWFWRGSDLKLIVSKGPVMVATPNLLGLTATEAETELTRVGLKLGTVNQSFNPDTVQGQIYEYQGMDGVKVPEGSSLSIEVSLGPIPNVIDKNQAAAKQVLEAAGLAVISTDSEFSDTIAKGNVISAEPVQNPLRKGGEVNLVISKGPNTVIVPDVVGETISAAKRLLESLGLDVQVNTDQLTARWGIVKVKSQSAGANTVLKVGQSIVISSK